MTPQQITLVRHSWKLVGSLGPAAAALFYDELFGINPALRALFRGDMTAQGQRLLAMLDTAVGMLDRAEQLMPALRQLGRRHSAGYGVRDEHYEQVGQALMQTLGAGLGPAFTDDVRDAWATMYALVSRTMREAASQSTREMLETM